MLVRDVVIGMCFAIKLKLLMALDQVANCGLSNKDVLYLIDFSGAAEQTVSVALSTTSSRSLDEVP
jgi:hypothetical protein